MYNKNMERFVENRKIKIREQDEYITLQNALKIENIIQTGGMAKLFLNENNVLVNGIKEERRGRKLYPGDIVNFNKISIEIEK